MRYTPNHTLLPEQLERLAVEAMERLKRDTEGPQRFDQCEEHAANYVYYKAIRDERLNLKKVINSHCDNIAAIARLMRRKVKQGYRYVGLENIGLEVLNTEAVE